MITGLLVAFIVVGSRNLENFDPALVIYTFAVIFATWGMTRFEDKHFRAMPKLKAVFSLGAGVDGILADTEYPGHIPLVRFVDRTLSSELAQYCVLHVLIHHRQQRLFELNPRALLVPASSAKIVTVATAAEAASTVARAACSAAIALSYC